MMFRQDRRTFGIGVVLLALACVCVAQAASAQTTGSIVWWGNVEYWDLPTPNENFTAIAPGSGHGLALRDSGSIATWGNNGSGQCDVPEPNNDFVAVAAGSDHSLGLKNDGSILAWGLNDYGQCDVPAPNSGFFAVSACHRHSLGLKEDGSIVAWGWNEFGQCNVPEPNSDFVAIAAGVYTNLGLKADGSIVLWGPNPIDPDTGLGRYDVPEPNSDFVAIAAGIGDFLALKSDGSIVAWGDISDVPKPNKDFVAIAVGYDHALGLKENGRVVAWGANQWGQCDVPSPNKDFFAIAAYAVRHNSFGLKVGSVENQPPSAANDGYTTEEGVALSVAAPGVLGNDSDPDGDLLIAIWDSGPSRGTLDYLNEDGSFAYTPGTGFTGTDAFTYTAFDGEYDSNVATVTITVGGAVEPGGITGTVTDAGGPVKKATVTAWLDGVTEVARASTNPQGKYTLSGLDPGDYVVVAVKDDLEDSASATVYSGETTTGIDIVIE